MTARKPNGKHNLELALSRAAGAENLLAARTLVANAIVASMLPAGAVKGGTSLKLRFGDAATRFTTDLDAARAEGIDDFRRELEGRLSEGWEGFAGRLAEGRQAHPKDVPAGYVMQPFEVKLSYLGRPWCTVSLEVGHDEIGDAEEPEMVVPEEANAWLERIGFPPLGPIAVMPLRFQVAQKIHGATGPGSGRAHDLIDLQVIVANAGDGIDWHEVRRTCERLFAYRQKQEWPPTVTVGPDWPTLYADQLVPGALPTVDEAVKWANALIERIASS